MLYIGSQHVVGARVVPCQAPLSEAPTSVPTATDLRPKVTRTCGVGWSQETAFKWTSGVFSTCLGTKRTWSLCTRGLRASDARSVSIWGRGHGEIRVGAVTIPRKEFV